MARVRLRFGSAAVLVLIVSLLAFLGRTQSSFESLITSQEVPATPTDRMAGWANNSPMIAAHPNDALMLALAHRRDAPDFGCGLQMSGDGGASWMTANPVTEMPPGADKCYAPEIAFDGEGRFYYLFVGLAGPGNRPTGVFLTFSDNRGRTFSPPRRLLGGNKFGVRMAIDASSGGSGRIHLVWLDAGSETRTGGFGPGPNPILAAHSDDGGVTFSDPVRVSSLARERVVAPSLALGPDGNVYAAYYDLGADVRDYQGLEGPRWDGFWSLVVASSSDGGTRFDKEVVIDHAIVPPERVMLVFTMPPPGLVTVGRDGLCAAWTDARHGDPDALLRCSENAGGSWSEARRLNDDPIGNGFSQYQPRLAASSNGRIDAVFYDRRLDPSNRLNDVTATFSTDGGATFVPNVRLTSERSNSRLGPQYGVTSAEGQVEFGSRLGLLSTHAGLLAAWTDTRNGDHGKSTQDIFSRYMRAPDR